MSTNRVCLKPALSSGEYREIDRFCHGGIKSFNELSQFLKKRFLLDLAMDPDILGGFVMDSSNLPGHAEALCRPADERECAIIIRTCSRSGIPFTLSGGQTNLTGSATPQGGVVISTSRMLNNPELRVETASLSVQAPVGITLEDLRNRVLERSSNRFIFPVDPTSRAEATVGGAIACNASGFTPGESGALRNWVQSVDVLLPNALKIHAERDDYVSRDGFFLLLHDGEELVLPIPRYNRPSIKNASGPFSSADGSVDFVDLIVGSEGLFGMVTACTLRLKARPSQYLDLFFSLNTEEDAISLYFYLQRVLPGGAGSLSAFEYFGEHCRKFMKHEGRLFQGNNPVAVYLQIPLFDLSLDEAAEEWFAILESAPCTIDENAILVLNSERSRSMLLEARHSLPANALEVVKHRGTYTIMTDALVPPEHFPDFLHHTHQLIREAGIEYLVFGHLGDCHLHFTLLPEKGQLARATEVYDMIIAKSAELGGVYSGEHGTGKRKRVDFLRNYGQNAVESLIACKKALDPRFLLNRGNVFG